MNKSKLFLFGFLFVVIFIGVAKHADAATVVWDGGAATENWSSSTNWDGDYVPNATDTVVFSVTSTKSVTIDTDLNVQGITILSTYSTGTISQGGRVVVVGTSSFSMASGTWAVTTGTITINNGSFTLTGGYFSAPSSTGATSSIFVARDFTLSGGTFSAANATTTFVSASSTDDALITCNGTMGGAYVLNKATSGATSTLSSNCTVAGEFIRTQGVLNGSSSAVTLTLHGNFHASSTDTLGDSNLTLSFASSGIQYASSTGVEWGGPIQVNTTAGELRLSSNLVASSTCDIVQGTLSLLGRNLTCGGAFTIQDGAIFKLRGGETVTGSPNFQSSSTIFFTGDEDGAADTFTITNVSSTFDNVMVSSTDGTVDVFMLGTSTVINGNLDLLGGTLHASSTGNYGITLKGNWNSAATSTFTAASGTVTIATTTAKTITSGGESFYNLTLIATSVTITLEDGLDVNNNLTVTAGTLDTKSGESNAVTIGGNFANSGTFTARSGTVTFDTATVSSTISGSNTFNALNINAPGKTIYFTAGTSQTVSSNIVLAGGSGSSLTLRSVTEGTQWYLNANTNRTFAYVDVKDSNNSAGDEIYCSNGCTNSGNNTRWNFFALTGSSGSAPASSGGSSQTTTVTTTTVTPVSTTTEPAPVPTPVQVAEPAVVQPTAPSFSGLEQIASFMLLGSRGTNVTRLQEFLKADPSLYPEGIVSGYFGQLTLVAVRKFQCREGIACSAKDDPGYGRVGPRTRARINEIIKTNSVPAATVQQPAQADVEALQNQVKMLQAQLVQLLSQLAAELQKKAGNQ